jgi:hypothetical protein
MIEKTRFTEKTWVKNLILWVSTFIIVFPFFYKECLGGFRLIVAILRGIYKYNIFLIGKNYLEMFIADINPYFIFENFRSIGFIAISIIIIFAFYRISLFMTAQFVLPVTTYPERKNAYKYLIKYSKGQHGPAIFVREGEQIENPKDINSSRPGVILVDLSSAVALRKQEKIKHKLFSKQGESEDDAIEEIGAGDKKELKSKKNSIILDAKGSGVVFTEAGQRIFATLDLRKQSRSSNEIEAYTRDGIRVKTKINITFSLSDEPEKILVGVVRDEKGINIKGLTFSSEDQNGRIKIKEIFELDEEDALDVSNIIKSGTTDNQGEIEPRPSTSPYKFYRERILKAAYSRARKLGGELQPWYDAPMELATDIFRKVLAAVQYDDLFSISPMETADNLVRADGKKESSLMFISSLRSNFGRDVKMKGLLNFQLCVRRDGQPFKMDQPYDSNLIEKYPPVAFSDPKYNSVRKYGITILSAGFGEIRPVDPKIQEKMVENWRTKLRNEINLIRAEYELEAIRVKNRNRAQIQHETTYLLSSIFQSVPHFEEALALRVLNALETAVTDPSRQEITSTELYTMLENLYEWLLVEGEDVAYPLIESPREQNLPFKRGQNESNNNNKSTDE